MESTMIVPSKPVQQYEVKCKTFALLATQSSLFIGLGNSSILEWHAPGEIKRTFTGHTKEVNGIIKIGDTLWSGSEDKSIKLWNINTGMCIKTINTQSEVNCLVMWKEHVLTGGWNDP